MGKRVDMVTVLQTLGVELKQGADFSKMYEPINWRNLLSSQNVETARFRIAEITQQNQFEVNEVRAHGKSITRSSGWGIACSAHMMPPTPTLFKADSPFVFVVFHKPSQRILFIGSYSL